MGLKFKNSKSDTRFLLTAEISNIIQKGCKTRKIHNVIFAPDFETAEKIQNKLSSLKFNIIRWQTILEWMQRICWI